ncbi:family 16 glycosylhydrolase [Micromonospora deserti]|nr:family 16 glycosylhydrolase [Micromonospora deserti]
MNNAWQKIQRLTRLGAVCVLLATTLVAIQTTQPAQAADVPPNPLDKPGWILDRNDEFNGSLDNNLWITNYLESRTPESRSRARYGFRNNALVLRIDGDQPTYYSNNPMKVSSIQTGQRTDLHKNDRYDHSIPTIMKYTPQHGYFEIRAKSNGRSGIHTAFWMIGKQDTWEQRGELDIMEHAGIHGRSRFNYNLFRWSDPNLSDSTQSVSVGFDMTTEMHIYAVEWTPTQLKLYVDNVLTRTINQSLKYPAVFLLGIYESAGWTGSVDPNDARPKEFVVDYFRAYKKDSGGDGDLVNGATYKIKNAATGRYLDSETNGVVIATDPHQWNDQDWIATQQSNGTWTFLNAVTGRYYLDSDATNNRVIWNNGEILGDSRWRVEPASGGFRLNNDRSDRSYMYATSAGEVKWNTGSTDGSTVWIFERK